MIFNLEGLTVYFPYEYLYPVRSSFVRDSLSFLSCDVFFNSFRSFVFLRFLRSSVKISFLILTQ